MRQQFAIVLMPFALLAACTSTPGPAPQRLHNPDAVVGKLWQWEETVTPVERIKATAPERYTLQLQADGRVAVRFDCNRGGGSYKIETGRLSFGSMMNTLMACPPDSQDHRFAKDLGQITSFFVEDGKLYLEMPVDSGTMRFRPAN
jgi:heat shock protein HslJ